MDGFTIDAFSPQEDEFALLALGVPSLYRCFFDPRRLPELTCWLNPDAWKHNHPEGWMDIWCEFLAGIADGKPGRLLLKSPNHTFRVRALLERFPKAAYVWVVRDPVEVFFSNRKMWSSMFQRYALWDWNMSDLDRFLQRAFESTAQCLRHASQALPVEKLVVVEFSRLTHAPVITINAVNSRLSFGEWEMFRPAIAEIAARKAAYRADAYDGQQVPSAVIPAIEALREAQQAALASHGF
jgi:hypothetical protein